VVSKKSFSKRSEVRFILILDTSGLLLLEQENKNEQITNRTMDNLITDNAFEVLTLQRNKLISKHKVKLLWEDGYENIFSTTKLSYWELR